MIAQHPRTPLDLEQWGRGYFKSGYSYGKNKYFSGFGVAPLIPAAIQAGASIFGAIWGRRGVSAAERQQLWMEFFQRQSEAYSTQQTLLYGVLPAVAILGGVLLLRK